MAVTTSVVLVLWIILLWAGSARALARHESDQVYEGVVVERRSTRVQLTSGTTRTEHRLRVRCDDGTEQSRLVDSATWAAFEEGDRIVKRAGERRPVKG